MRTWLEETQRRGTPRIGTRVETRRCDDLREQVAVTLEYQHQPGKEPPGVDAPLSVGRMHMLGGSTVLCGAAEQPQQTGRSEAMSTSTLKQPTPWERLHSSPAPRC